MAFSIGRAGLTLALSEPLNWQNSGGGTVTLTGTFLVSGSVTDSLRLRDQLLGYAGNFDEPIVPVISGAQPRDTGYYRVVSVDIPTTAESLLNGIHAYSIVLQPLPGYAQPQFESIITGDFMTNAVGALVTDMYYFHAVPSATVEYMKGAGGSVFTRVGSDGNIQFYNGGNATDTAHFYLNPSDYYVGAATIEQGSPLQPIVGRQLAQADIVNWRLSNGLVRVTPNATAGKIDVSHWKGASWAAAKTYKITETANGYLMNAWTTFTVLRNSPEKSTIRLGALVSLGINWGRITVDLTLRRGDRVVRGYLSSDAQGTWQIARDVTEASVANNYGAVTTGNIRASFNDADNNRFVLASLQKANTSDLANGKLTQTVPNNTLDFGIGSAIGGNAAVAPDDTVSIAKQYLAEQDEKQQTVAR